MNPFHFLKKHQNLCTLLYSLSDPNIIPIRPYSLPGPYLSHTWFIFGPCIVPPWSCMVLTWFLHGPYLVSMVHKWSLPVPCPYRSLFDPYLICLVTRSLCAPVPWSTHFTTWSLYMFCVVPTRSLPYPGQPSLFPVPNWSLPVPYLLVIPTTWSLPCSLKKKL